MSSVRLQEEFFAQMADPQAIRAIFEHLPGVFFFVKDAHGRHIAANSQTFVRFGIQSERELIGAMDERFFPEEWAKAFRADDQKVIRSGKPPAAPLWRSDGATGTGASLVWRERALGKIVLRNFRAAVRESRWNAS